MILVTLLIAVLAVDAQNYVIKNAGYNGFYNSTAARVTAATAYTFQLSEVNSPFYYTYAVKLVDNTGSNTASVVLSGSLNGADYKTISTVNYTGAGADTAIIANITANPLSYRFLKITVTPSDTMWVKSVNVNIAPL